MAPALRLAALLHRRALCALLCVTWQALSLRANSSSTQSQTQLSTQAQQAVASALRHCDGGNAAQLPAVTQLFHAVLQVGNEHIAIARCTTCATYPAQVQACSRPVPDALRQTKQFCCV